MKNKLLSLILSFFLIISLVCGCTLDATQSPATSIPTEHNNNVDVVLLASAYSGSPYIAVNNNIPYFTDDEKSNTTTFEIYSELDDLGRCGVAYANLSRELMPTEDRESLSGVTPSGWKNKKYDIVDGGWLYNRAHIIGFQLAGEQANKLNLITGTRYFNVDGMLTFENMVADHIKECGGHVLYRVTPIFSGNNLVAEGVLMEAWSVEDEGESICFNVFCYNVQPNITIDYATGDSWLASEGGNSNVGDGNNQKATYILNTNSKKIHKETCSGVDKIADGNRRTFVGDINELLNDGYECCGICKPQK